MSWVERTYVATGMSLRRGISATEEDDGGACIAYLCDVFGFLTFRACPAYPECPISSVWWIAHVLV